MPMPISRVPAPPIQRPIAELWTLSKPLGASNASWSKSTSRLIGKRRDTTAGPAGPAHYLAPRTGGSFYTGPMSTIELPDDVAAALAVAAAERGVTVDELAAEALAERFGPRRRVLSFAGVGSSTTGRSAAEAEELLEEGGFGIDSADR